MTPAQVKSKFRREGKTITQFAADHGYPRNAVYRVLNGCDKAHYGRAHEIAVKLGLKEGTATESSAPAGPDRRHTGRRATDKTPVAA